MSFRPQRFLGPGGVSSSREVAITWEKVERCRDRTFRRRDLLCTFRDLEEPELDAALEALVLKKNLLPGGRIVGAEGLGLLRNCGMIRRTKRTLVGRI